MVNHDASGGQQEKGEKRIAASHSDVQTDPANEHPANKEPKWPTKLWGQIWPRIVADAKKVKIERIKFLIELGLALAVLYVYSGQLEVMKGTLEQMQGSSQQSNQLIILTAQQVSAVSKQADLIKQEVDLQAKVATAALGADVRVSELYIRHQRGRVWAIIQMRNSGRSNAESVCIAANLAFLDSVPPTRKFTSADFKIPQEGSVILPATASPKNLAFYKTPDITISEQWGTSKTLNAYVWLEINYKVFGYPALPVRLCQYASAKSVLAATTGNYEKDGYDYTGRYEVCSK